MVKKKELHIALLGFLQIQKSGTGLPGQGIYKRKKESKKQENTHSSTQTRTRPRKKELVQENTHSYTKASMQKRTQR